jgi:hypothetical protein
MSKIELLHIIVGVNGLLLWNWCRRNTASDASWGICYTGGCSRMALTMMTHIISQTIRIKKVLGVYICGLYDRISF